MESSSKIAIIGAGPAGLEAALYARYLGYQARIYDSRAVGESFFGPEQVPLPTSVGENRTTLGVAALRAQDENYAPASSGSGETPREFAESYLLPLAQSDLIADSLFTQHTVVQVQRGELEAAEEGESMERDLEEARESIEVEATGEEEAYDWEFAPFELLIRRHDGGQTTHLAEIVIDASGDAQAAAGQAGDLLVPTPELPKTEGVYSVSQAIESLSVEPNYFRLGSRAPASQASCSIPEIHEQIRRLFAFLGGRESLNLYATFKRD